ncbi:MAG: hypothetical protein WCH44_18080 [Betaproteobacteria bacterium]
MLIQAAVVPMQPIRQRVQTEPGRGRIMARQRLAERMRRSVKYERVYLRGLRQRERGAG